MKTYTRNGVNDMFMGFEGKKVTSKNRVAKSKQLIPVEQVVKSLRSQTVEKELDGKKVRVYNPTKSKDTKTYKVAGVSVWKGIMKVRFANTLEQRKKVLARNEHTDIRLVEVNEGTKADVARQLLTNEQFQDKWAQETIRAFLSKNA